MTIRQVCSDEVGQAVRLDQEVFGFEGTNESPDVIVARYEVHPQGFIVAEHHGNIVGYASSERWPCEREPQLDENPRDTHDPKGVVLCITAMAVAAHARGGGVGAMLLQHLIELAQTSGCAKVMLETVQARAFYEKFGFTYLYSRQQDNACLLVMEKNLSTHAANL